MSDADFAVVDTTTLFQGRIVGVREDVVRMPDGSQAKREIVAHMGAVVIVALDADENVVLVRQYRPAVRAWLTELPAGLLDVDGEPAHVAASRELAEEAQLSAATWHTLARSAHVTGVLGRNGAGLSRARPRARASSGRLRRRTRGSLDDGQPDAAR